ncbi:MAG TPA: hypothetical protein VH502_09400 [Actinoplanes sp.]
MTGNAPQPGETPRTEGNPWSFDPDAAWWRGDGDREQAEALAEVAGRPREPRRRSTPAAAESAEPAAEANPMLGETLDAHAAGAQDAADELQPPAVPGPDDVMVLPEPQRNRPTVPLDRGRAAGRDPAELDVKLSRIEESPFWLTEEERSAATNPAPATGTPVAEPVNRPGGRVRRTGRSPRRAAPGLVGLVALALIATFFSWVSAEPFWLAVGHGDRGTATVARCIGSGVTQRCTGSFAATDGAFAVQKVTVLGVDPAHRAPGSTAAARMVDPHSRQAYVGNTGLLVHLRWVLGFVLVLLCGIGIAGLTGTRRLETLRARRTALLMSLAGPLILLAGFLAAAF